MAVSTAKASEPGACRRRVRRQPGTQYHPVAEVRLLSSSLSDLQVGPSLDPFEVSAVEQRRHGERRCVVE